MWGGGGDGGLNFFGKILSSFLQLSEETVLLNMSGSQGPVVAIQFCVSVFVDILGEFEKYW